MFHTEVGETMRLSEFCDVLAGAEQELSAETPIAHVGGELKAPGRSPMEPNTGLHEC